jgi:hypothetical protein
VAEVPPRQLWARSHLVPNCFGCPADEQSHRRCYSPFHNAIKPLLSP